MVINLPNFRHDVSGFAAIELSVDLGHGWRAMIENDTSRVNAELLAQKSRGAVPQAIRSPTISFAPLLRWGLINPPTVRSRAY